MTAGSYPQSIRYRVSGDGPGQKLRRVLMISPHFPPDSSAGSHRVRLLAPHLKEYGWEPTVLAADSAAYEGRLDPDLEAMVPRDLRVVRVRAMSPAWTRMLGVGDLGLRAFGGLWRGASRLFANEVFDMLFITIYPTYPALMGPMLKRRFGVPFVLDYQDPWVGEWGKTAGPGKGGRADLKSRLSRAVATVLEPRAALGADAITAVSERTYEDVLARVPAARGIPCRAIALGGEPRDFEYLRAHPRSHGFFDPHDGCFHLCYVGTLLPLGYETLRAVFSAAAALRQSSPEMFAKLRFHFFGTSNQSAAGSVERAVPVAAEFGVRDIVAEQPSRIDYLDALAVQTSASGLLLMGSSEPHYTASKIYPALLAAQPVLAVYHEKSSVVEVLRDNAGAASVRIVTYGDASRALTRVDEISRQLEDMIAASPSLPASPNPGALDAFSARAMAGSLARLFDDVVGE